MNNARNLNSLVEGLLDSKIEGHLNQVLVKYLINEVLYCKYVTGIQHYKLKLVLKYKKKWSDLPTVRMEPRPPRWQDQV